MKKGAKVPTASRQWKFFRAGGFDQVRLDCGADLTGLEQLDRKLWVALACPVDNIHFDRRTLSLIDADGDRRIRAEELIAAVKWTASRLNNADSIVKSTDGISAGDIAETCDDGKNLAATCRRALVALGKKETDLLTVEDSEKTETTLAQQPFNGDGIITEASTQDEKVRTLIREIIATTGFKTDRSGAAGVDADLVETFFSNAASFAASQAELETDPSILPLGGATADAAAAFETVRVKIDDFFVRCAMAGFDDRAAAALDGRVERFDELGAAPLTETDERLSALPLARVTNKATLPLTAGSNPAWTDRITSFSRLVIDPVFGPRNFLTATEWRHLTTLFAPWRAWRQRTPAGCLEQLGYERVRALLSGNERTTIMTLIENDRAESVTFEALVDLEKLVRFKRDLYRLCCNFVNFRDFYSGKGDAIFQAGMLYLDQRSCLLCMTVDDVGRHSTLAAMAGAYLVYCDCRRRGGTDKKSIVAAFTDGDSENLMVGRNGVFYDRAGNDWDATITKIIENPISMKQAFWLPYKNLVRMIESQVAKRATAAEAQSTSLLEKTATQTATIDKNTVPPPPKKVDIGTVAALGVAAGALGTFLATLMGYATGIIRLGPLAIVGALVGVLLLISGPSLVLAYIKLRKRNLGPILDAGGWAINAKARINVPFGAALTKCATLPPGSQRDLFDPFAEKKSLWPKIIIAAFCIWIAWFALDKSGVMGRFIQSKPGIRRLLIDKLPMHRQAPGVKP